MEDSMTADESIKERDPSVGTRKTNTQVSVYVRWARRGYLLFAGAFAIGVAIQVFIAGMSVFVDPANWSMHASFVHVLELLTIVMLVLAFLGRLPRRLKLIPVALFLLIGVQYATALGFRGSVVAAIHPVNALVIFWISVSSARQAWPWGQTR
jgi:mercuric ion transport protein